MMLAELYRGDISSLKDYIYERKYDGIRVNIELKEKIKLINRRNVDITYRYPEVEVLKGLNLGGVLDGELIIPNQKLSILQTREKIKNLNMIKILSIKYPIKIMVFDVIEINEKCLKSYPLWFRKDVLDNLKEIIKSNVLEFIEYTKNGEGLWNKAIENNWEGVIAKHYQSKYYDKRSNKWFKIKTTKVINNLEVIGLKTDGKREISSLITKKGNVSLSLSHNLYKNWVDILKKKIDNVYVDVEYLEFTDSGKMRFPVLKKIYKDG